MAFALRGALHAADGKVASATVEVAEKEDERKIFKALSLSLFPRIINYSFPKRRQNKPCFSETHLRRVHGVMFVLSGFVPFITLE